MKKLFILSLIVIAGMFTTVSAQGPAASPASKTIQTIGTTEITVAYSRPSVKGRDIFGALVPYGAMWRTGANAATKISFSKDVKVEGKDLMAGDYALFTTPGKDEWAIHFFKFETPGAGDYANKTPALTVKVKPMMMEGTKVESFLIVFDTLKNDSGEMDLLWDNVAVPIQLGVK